MEFKYEYGRIYYEKDGKVLAEVVFPITDGVADIQRTFVDDSLRGQGIASILIEKAVEVIRYDNLRAKATCSYAASWFTKHPWHNDLLV
ncbi:MAG: GNAT family N-acetyltransferase [Eubacteriales bacterium]|nr:GNAT family N-acetyltransferase [Eubacteriales bacterium]